MRINVKGLTTSCAKHVTVAARDYVTQGAALYLRGNFPESLAAYAEARKLASQTRSLFDDLWIELNEVDTQIRLGQFKRAREMLNHIVTVSRENRFIWLNAKALSIYGYTVKLTASYGEMMNLLSEADRTFVSIDAPRDRIRVLYYLSFYRYGAGDQEQALRLALECLRLTNEDDPLRISTLEWLIGSILYRRGMVQDVKMDFSYGTFGQRSPEAYERLLLDALRGDPSLFTRSDEVEEAWRFISGIQEGWASLPNPAFPNYEPGSVGPDQAKRLLNPTQSRRQ